MSENTTRLTKSGKPDKRCISSKMNISKAHSVVKDIITKSKQSKNTPDEDDVESDEDSETEYFITPVRKKVSIPRPVAPETIVNNNDDMMMMKLNSLTKSIDELKQENHKLKSTFVENDRLQCLNSLTKKMLLKF